jgi:hypothetical protein
MERDRMKRTASDGMDIPSSSTWRVSRQPRGMDPATKKLALIAAGVGGGLVLLVGLWSAIGHRPAGIPVIAADSRPFRVKPENPGGLQIAGANDEILSGGDTDGETGGKLAPPPETPEPQVLRAQQDAARAAEEAAKAVPAPPPTPAQMASLPAPARTAADQAVHESHPPPVAAALPERRPAPPPPVQHPASAASPAPAHAQPGARQVQLAALVSEDAARTEWQRLARLMPDLFNGRQPAFSKTERDGHVFWRLRTGGFTDTAQATIFCERVRAKGAGCSVASF